jgi:glutathione S-transferase
MTVMPAELLSAVVTILAVLFFYYTGFGVGRMRGKHGIKAPAMTGNIEFESAVRVQENTLEQIVVFLPLLWLATTYFHTLAWLSPAFGVVWLVGRVLYMRGYMQSPDKRGTGFMISLAATVGLLVLSIIGIVQAWIAIHAA